MKKGFVTIMLLWFVFGNTHAQDSNANPSPQSIIDQVNDPRIKVDTILYFSDSLIKEKTQEALKFSRQAYDVASKIKYTNGKADALYSMSRIYRNIGKLDTADIIIRSFIDLAKETKDTLMMGRGYVQLASILRRTWGNEKAEVYYLIAKDIFEKHNYVYGMISAYNGLGIVNKNKENYDSAAKYYHMAMKLSIESNYHSAIGSILINLGKIYLLNGEDSLAKIYFYESIPFNQQVKNLKNVALAYKNIGIVEMNNFNNDSANYYFDKSMEIEKEIGNILGINNLYINQATVHIRKMEYPAAIQKYNLALESFNSIGYPEGYITALFSKAELLSIIGLYKQAILLLDSSINMAVKQKDLSLQESIYRAYQNHYANTGNYKKALEYQTMSHEIQESRLSIDKQKRVAEMRLQYEKEQDLAKILALKNDNLQKDLQLRKRTNQRNIYMFAGSAIVFLAIIILIFYRIKSKNDNYMAMQRIRQLEKDKKLISAQFLLEGQEEERKRIAKELHDGIGVLLSTAKMQFTSIDGITPSSKPKINNATKLLEMAASEVRKITHNMMPGLLTKYGFYEAIDDLVEQINESGSLAAQLMIEGKQDRFSENKEFMLYRIVQEMINNTLKHAEATKLEIKIKLFNNKLNLQYTDNGKGFVVEEKLHNQSIGLTSIQSRSNYIGGKLSLDSSPGNGTKYELQVTIS